MIKDDYIVRIWPSGTITMGKVYFQNNDNKPMFTALETYPYEGSVYKDQVYGYIDSNTSYKHRLATPVEIQVFHLCGLNKKEDEIKQLHRQIVLESII